MTYRNTNDGRNSRSRQPNALAPALNSTAHMTNSARYRGALLRRSASVSDKPFHLRGVTASHLMLAPCRYRSTAATVSPRPSQTAHQSSLRRNSFRPVLRTTLPVACASVAMGCSRWDQQAYGRKAAGPNSVVLLAYSGPC